jgi:hypothetical protein
LTLEFPFTSKYPTIFVRLKGRNGTVREYRALINTVVDYCILPRVDAYRLGYPEASHDDFVTIPANLVRLVSSTGFAEGMMILMAQVEVGELKVESLPFLALDLPQVVGFDVVIGRNFFLKASVRVEMDFPAGKIRMESLKRS